MEIIDYTGILKKQEEEIKNNTNQLATAENNNPENNVEASELTNTEIAVDTIVSPIVGYGEGLTQLLDLPFILDNAFKKGGAKVALKVAKMMNMNDSDIEEMEQKYKAALASENQIRPGKYLREKFLTYDTKLDANEFSRSAMEFASPSIFTKAKMIFGTTGAVSGAIKEGVEQGTGSEAAGYGVGAAVNLGLDLYMASRGNTSGLAKHIIPDNEKDIKKIKEIQKYAKDKGLILKTSEASGNKSIIKMDGTIESSIIGNKVVDKFWANRPAEMKDFIAKWGKDNGIISTNKSLSVKELNAQYEKAAIALESQGSQMWLLNGGAKIKNFNYSSTQVNDMIIALEKAADGGSTGVQRLLKDQVAKIKKSNGNGQVMHNSYKIFRDLKRNGVFTNEKSLDKFKYADMASELKNVLKTNSGWTTANEKYSKFYDGFVEPITKGSMTQVFNDIKKINFSKNPENMGKLFSHLNSPLLSKKDIIRFADSVNASKVPGLLEDTISTYFNSKFIVAASDGMKEGINTGVIFYNSIMKNEATKGNFTEMLYQLAKTKNANVKYKDIENSVVKFANVLKASGKSGQAGSSTAANLIFKEGAEANKYSFAIETGQLLQSVNKFFKQRAFTKTSNELAEAMVSDRGIDALLDLAANWKDQAKVLAYVRSLTFGAEGVASMEQDN